MRYVRGTGVLFVYSQAATDQPPPTAENSGWAVFEDSSKGIAVVTSQPGQTLNPLSESLQRSC